MTTNKLTKPQNKLNASIEIKRAVPYTSFKINVPKELTEAEREINKEVVFRTYDHAMRYVQQFIDDTEIPLRIDNKVKQSVHTIRMDNEVKDTTDKSDKGDKTLRPRYRPNKMVTVERTPKEIKQDKVERLVRLKDRGQINDYDLITKLMEVV